MALVGNAPQTGNEQFIPGVEIISVAGRKRIGHVRLLIAHVADMVFYVLTPGGDLVEENFDKAGIRFFVRDHVTRSLPLAVSRLEQDFDELPERAEFDSLCERAEDLISQMPAENFGHQNGEEQEFDDSLPDLPVPARGRVLTQIPPAHPRGAVRPPAHLAAHALGVGVAGTPPLLSGGLGALAAAISGRPPAADTPQPSSLGDGTANDARTSPILLDAQGLRFREFRHGVALLDAHPWDDWPCSGPRTVLWVCKFMVQKSGTPLSWHQQWKMLGKLGDAEHLVMSHEFACRALEVGVCYDQVNIACLASYEILARQIQTVEDLLSHKFEDASTSTDISLMSGVSSRSVLCISPELKAWIAAETSRDAAILKERRKAREERVLAAPKKQGK